MMNSPKTEIDGVQIADFGIRFVTAFFALNQPFTDIPKRIGIELTLANGTVQEHILAPEQLTAKDITDCASVCITHPKMFNKLMQNYLQSVQLNSGTGLVPLDTENNVKNVEIGYLFNRSGLHILPNGCTVYILGKRLIGNCGRPFLIETEDAQSIMDRGTGSLVKLCELLLTARHPVLLAFAFLAVTLVRSGVRRISSSWQAVLYILGKQGFGKTTLAHVLVDWIKDEDGDSSFFFEAGSSVPAVREEMTNACDLPLVVDDLCRSASQAAERKRMELGAQLVREGANAAPIIKKRPGGQTEKLKCTTGLILTAEFKLENASDVTRSIYLNIDQPLGLPKELTADLVGGAVTEFLEWFVEYEDSAFGQLRAILEENEYPKLHQRVCKNFTILKWGFQQFLCAAVDKGLATAVVKKLMEDFNMATNESTEYQNELLRKLDANFKKGNIAAILLGGLENGGFQLTKKLSKLPTRDGLIWKNDLCLRKDPLERFVRMQDGYGSYTLRQILRELKDIGALVLNENTTDQVKIEKRSPRVYRIRLDVLRSESKIL